MKRKKYDLAFGRGVLMKINKTYDVCFGVGEACMCSQSLRAAGLQFASYPFDWVGSLNPLRCAQILAADFKDYINREDFEYRGSNAKNGLGMYTNTRTGFGHPHDFADRPVIDDEMYKALTDKYSRRISRLCKQLSTAKRALMVAVCVPATPTRSHEELIQVRATVLARYPSLELDLLVFQHDKAIPLDKSELEQISEGVYQIRFAYEHAITLIDIAKIVAALKELEVKAVDFRSIVKRLQFSYKNWREKRNNKLKRKFDKYSASTLTEYVIKRFILRVRPHKKG